MAKQNVKELIKKFALKNALDYGKAQEGIVISKMIAADPSVKKDMKLLVADVKSVVAEVNKMGKAELEKEFSKYAEEFKSAAEEKAEQSSKHSFHIEGAEEGKFVTRFPPEPGGYMHIGHAKPVFIEDELRHIYKGKLMLYFDDTNPDLEKQEFVDAFHDDLKWLGIKFDGEYYASDNLPILYDYAKTAINNGKAYVCTCDAEKIKEARASGTACGHKKQSKKANLELWKKMLDNGFGDNEAILRFNADMKALNTTMRDPTLFRIKHAPHYRQKEKYFVWPTYDFCTPIVDSTRGITDVLRSKEYELRDELYFAVLDALDLRKPRITSFSRLEIANNVTSKRKIRALIAEKQVKGYDDPRLVTIMALRKRGVTAEAIKEFALSFGMGKSESVANIGMLLAINKRIVDKGAKRLFFIEKPIALQVNGLDEKSEAVSLRFHPTEELGYRHYKLGTGLFINAADLKQFKSGDIVRLKDAFNIRVESIQKNKVTATYIGSESMDAPRIQWIVDKQECELWDIGDLLNGESFNNQSITIKKGYAEGCATGIKNGEIVYFEKTGLYKLDDRKKSLFLSI